MDAVDKRLWHAELLDDFGFASAEGARSISLARKARRAEAHRELIDAVIGRFANAQKLVQHAVEGDGDKPLIRTEGSALVPDYRKGIIAYRAIERIGCNDMGQHELLQSVDAILQFLELVLINSGHGGESPVVGEPAPFTPASNTPHCLSETAE